MAVKSALDQVPGWQLIPKMYGAMARNDAGVASEEDLSIIERYKSTIGLNSESTAYFRNTDAYKVAMIDAQARAKQYQAKQQVADTIRLNEATKIVSNVVTADKRQPTITLGGTDDSTERARKKSFAEPVVSARQQAKVNV